MKNRLVSILAAVLVCATTSAGQQLSSLQNLVNELRRR